MTGLLRNLGSVLRSSPSATNVGPETQVSAFQDRMVAGLDSFAGPVLVLLSEDDYTAKEFVEYAAAAPAWRHALARRNVESHTLAGADHTFSAEPALRSMVDRTLQWVGAASLAARS